MKNTLIVAASAFAMISAAPAFAQAAPTASGDIQLSATVAKACGVGNHLSGADSAPGWDQSDITVPLADANGQFNGATYTNRSFGNVWCNGPATVTLEASALKITGAAPFDTSSFSDRFDVEVTTDAGVYVGQGTNYTFSTVGTANGVKTVTGPVTSGAFETGLQRFGGANSIKILPSVVNGRNKRPIAGNYSGYVRFTATAN